MDIGDKVRAFPIPCPEVYIIYGFSYVFELTMSVDMRNSAKISKFC